MVHRVLLILSDTVLRSCVALEEPEIQSQKRVCSPVFVSCFSNAITARSAVDQQLLLVSHIVGLLQSLTMPLAAAARCAFER